METTITRLGQTVIPAAIRKRYGISDGGHLAWWDDGETIRVVPVPADAIQGLRGSGRGEGLTAKLLAERRKERERER
jgi:AbrB family looped-hinge helix DNA binding protein